MKKAMVYLLFSCLIMSCGAQHDVKISVTNRSTQPIDSIIIPYRKEQFKKVIEPNETESLMVHLKDKDIKGEGAFDIYLYQKGKKFRATWGFHDLNTLEKNENNFFFFENGINYQDKALQPPKEFTLLIGDQSTNAIDSINVKPESLKKITHARPRSFEIVVDWVNFSKNPVLVLYQSGKAKEAYVQYDWSNWTLNQVMFILSDGGIVSKRSN